MNSESPQIHRRPTRAMLPDSQRDSNVVRASVLETALELGLGHNSTVAHWIFNNPLSEESEDLHLDPVERGKPETKLDLVSDVAEATTPTFTSGSNSTSDESSSLNSPGNLGPSAAITIPQALVRKPSMMESPHVHFDEFHPEQLKLFSPFAASLRDGHSVETRDNPLGKLSRGAERSSSQDDSLRAIPNHGSPSPVPTDPGYTSDGLYISKGKANKGKDKPERGKNSRGSKPQVLDSGKSSERDGDYLSDGGYISASSNKSQGKSPGKVKSRAIAFFRRRPKKSMRGSDDEDEDNIPPVPAIPAFPTPSNPRPLERRARPSSPTRSGFSPLTLNLANPSASPPRGRVSKSPPAHARATSPQRSEHLFASQRSGSAVVVSAPTASTPAGTAVAIPLPPSMPGTPLTTASPSISPPSTQLTAVPATASTSKSVSAQSSRQHLNIPPPVPPPTAPLPQPPPSPSSCNGALPATSTTLSRRGSPARPIPVVPTTPGPTLPLNISKAASPFRPSLSPRTVSYSRAGEPSNGRPQSDHLNGKDHPGRQRSVTPHSVGFGSTPAFLQRRIQNFPPPSPRHPPPDAPLPPSPGLAPNAQSPTPIGKPSKFHEHLSSVSSVPLSHILSAPSSTCPSPSLSGSSSGPSVRSHGSTVSERSKESVMGDSLNVPEHYRPGTSASTVSEASLSLPFASRSSRTGAADLHSRFSNRSDASLSVYSQVQQDNISVSIYEDDDGEVDETGSKEHIDVEDDDASIYPSDDKTAGRRTMYLMEHGESDENGDEIVIAGSHYWGEEAPPPVPPLPRMPIRPGPGYF